MIDNHPPFKGEMKQTSICDTCIHKCIFKDTVLCNIDTNPTLFYYNSKINPIKECKDYCFIDNSYPKINIHSIWEWYKCSGFVYSTPVIVCCKHEIPEYEHNSIEELYPHCSEITQKYGIKLNGFPWVVNLAEVSKENGIKKYRTNLISDEEINNIMKNINVD